MMRKMTLVVGMLAVLGARPAFSQDTFHVFPQVADGRFSDGTFYKSTLMVLPFFDTDPATCSLRLYGMTAAFGTSGVTDTVNIAISAGSPYVETTAGTQSLKSDYATLTCSDYVFAQMLYSFYGANGAKLSEATVFSSP